jgi:hypothetical protein
MNERLQAYLEGSLGPADRAAFERELRAESPALYEAVRAAAARPSVDPDAEPSPWFAERVLARLEARKATWPVRLREALFAPRIRPASALAAVLLTAALVATLAPRREPAPVAATPAPAETQVVLRLAAPGAARVHAVGDFNGWSKDATPLVPAGNGEWVARLRLPPGVYQYTFLVDGKTWVTTTGETVDDGFGNRNSLLRL